MSDERKKQRDYEGDVIYEVWRRGGNPDQVDYDRVIDDYYNGIESDHSALQELKRQRRQRAADAEN